LNANDWLAPKAIAVLMAFTVPAFADNLTGRASIIDGDTLEIHGTRIRLWGIDAPESSQLCRGDDSLQYRCGAKAANELDAFIARRPVDCSPVGLARTVAVCSIDGVDIADWLVRNGLALDWPKYSKGKYDQAQRDAEHAGRGMWEGSYVEPWLFRACVKRGGRTGDCSDDTNEHPVGTLGSCLSRSGRPDQRFPNLTAPALDFITPESRSQPVRGVHNISRVAGAASALSAATRS
jgi:endonuclease YncB( thermonuclease family)